MSEMIERVARVLAERSWDRMNAADSNFAKLKYPDGIAAYCEQRWALYGYDAYRVITAMREPTEAMVIAADRNTMTETMWRDMIDEALPK